MDGSEWKYRHDSAGGGKCKSGNIGTIVRGWKMQERKGRHDSAGGGKCKSGKVGTIVRGVENAGVKMRL